MSASLNMDSLTSLLNINGTKKNSAYNMSGTDSHKMKRLQTLNCHSKRFGLNRNIYNSTDMFCFFFFVFFISPVIKNKIILYASQDLHFFVDTCHDCFIA